MEDVKEIFPKKEPEQESGGLDIFSYVTKAGETIPPWWSPRRDRELRNFWKRSDNLSSAIYSMTARMTSIPIRFEAKDKSITAHVRQAEEFTELLLYNTFSRSAPLQNGWVNGWGFFLADLYTQDNGAFFVIEGPGKADGPLTGRPTALIHLDSGRVTRKGSAEFPIVYQDYDGKLYKIHHSRVISMASMPSSIQSMYGVGFCAVSRCVNYVQQLIDMGVYKQEKLGSRPKERLIIGKRGITAQDIARAFLAADQSMDAQGLTRYSKTVVLAPNTRSTSAEVDLEIQDLVNAGELFDEHSSASLGMYTVALAFGVPARWLWPATATGATKADAEYQHLVGMVTGPGEVIRQITNALNMKFIPPQLQTITDYQDDAKDEQQAQIRKARADQRKTDIADQVITIRTAREQALSAGDITQAQFDTMEMEDGRLPSGDDLLSIFSNLKDELLVSLLDVGVTEPLDIDGNDAIDMIIAIDEAALNAQDFVQNAPTAPQREKARVALHALGKLKKLYEQKATDEIAQEITEEMEFLGQVQKQEDAQLAAQAQKPQRTISQKPQTEEPPEEEKPQEEGQPPTEEQTTEETSQEEETPEGEMPEEKAYGVKQFDFGARAGEIIGGSLARGPDGRFINVAQLGGAIRARMLARIRERKNPDEAWTLDQNRAQVEAALAGRIPEGGINALAILAEGGVPDAGPALDGLMDLGMAKTNPDGSVQISPSGASFLIAANSGSVTRAKNSLIMAAAWRKPAKAAGKPKKPSKEQRIAENRASIKADTDLDSLYKFDDGEDISDEAANSLSQDGLTEFAEDGRLRLTAAGRSFMEAANRGDNRDAQDALSRGRSRVAESKRLAADAREKADQLTEQIQEVEEHIARLDPRANALRIALLKTRLRRMRSKQDKQYEKARKIENRIGRAPEPTEAPEPIPPSTPRPTGLDPAAPWPPPTNSAEAFAAWEALYGQAKSLKNQLRAIIHMKMRS